LTRAQAHGRPRYINGTDDRDGMACRINCGYTWTPTDLGWRVQVLPGA
jgi:hypothetical protein